MNKKSGVGRLVIIRYRERDKIKSHTAGAGKKDTEESIREWFQKMRPRAQILNITFEETD